MDSEWRLDFERRMGEFSLKHPHSDSDAPVSIKVRVISGCFHREHSPRAYEIIDRYLRSLNPDEHYFRFEEHESGPEILVYVAGGIALAKSIIDLVATIIKARSESVNRGDRPSQPLELIVRYVSKDGEYHEERVLRVQYTDPLDEHEIARLLNGALPELPRKTSSRRREKRGKGTPQRGRSMNSKLKA